MRFATFRAQAGDDRLGVVLSNDRVLDLAAAMPGEPSFESMLTLIAAGEAGRSRAVDAAEKAEAGRSVPADAITALQDVRLRAPIPRPTRNVFCVGMNYPSHVEDNARALGLRPEVGAVPLFFSKPTTAVIGTGESILLDTRLTAKLDYEVELGVVIGRGGTWIDEAEALDHVFGYTVVNDVSARDLQWRTSQMFIGKGLDSYCPVGPWIVTPPDAGRGHGGGPEFELSCWVNGEQRQRDSTANMIFPVARIVAELSKGITLLPGDIIATGTPGGCGYQLEPPRFLSVGDTVECRADGIGSVVNGVAAWGSVPRAHRATAGSVG
jgi:2-keto-4-pentenoate hydratase/2-oxohepta-3-ene-1,7-dioic acid hydratase in catechol pathway